MSDITTAWDTQAGEADWAWATSAVAMPLVFTGGGQITFQGLGGTIAWRGSALASDLLSGADLQTAVLISLFSDRLADPSDTIPDGTGDRRGWWGDAGQTYAIGSRLWLLARAKTLPETPALAKSYCAEALQWLIADAVVGRMDIDCSLTGKETLRTVISLFRQNGQEIARFEWAWRGLAS